MFKIASLTSRLAGTVVLACSLAAPSAHAAESLLGKYIKCSTTQVTNFSGTIVDAAIATPQLSTLTSLVVAADLAGALSGPGPFTVFAPTNDAFAKVPAQLLGLIGGDPALLKSVLTYHVVAGHADPRRTLIPNQVKTLQGETLFLAFDADGASVNQSVASCTGVRTTNGTVWLIDSVLLPQFK